MKAGKTNLEELQKAKKTTDDELHAAKEAAAEAKRKAKDRKATIEAHQGEIDQLKASVLEANKIKEKYEEAKKQGTKYGDMVTKYNKLVGKHNNLIHHAISLKKQVGALDGEARKLELLQRNLWDVPVDASKVAPFRPLTKASAAIIAVINLKGGVGKTTLTANIGAAYCRLKDSNVLVVDLDFQASLTGLCVSADDFSARKIGVDDILRNPAADVATLAFNNTVRTREPKMRVLSGSENLANAEERSKATWLMRSADWDVRCIFRRALHDPQFQKNFDVILIDCPPRWTTASINAIACCDYVLVPTILDRVSAEAVPRLLKWLRNLKTSSRELYGGFEVLGVIGNLAYPRAGLVAQEREIWLASPKKCEAAWLAPVHHFGTIINDKSEFRRAANHREFAALHADLQPTFLSLLDEIEIRRSAHEGS